MRSKTDFYRLFFEQLARKGFDVKRSQSSDYIADIYYKNQLVAYFSKADTVIQNPFVAVKDKVMRLINDTAQNTAVKVGICRDCPYTDANEKLPNGSYKLAEYNGVTLACKEHHLFGYVFSTYRTAPDSGEMLARQVFYNKEFAGQDFAKRSGLVDEKALFSEEELRVLHAGLVKMSIEVNTNRHLQLLLNVYEAAPTGEHYTIDGIDCYLTNEPDREYQFIIYDCGVMQAPTSVFREADHRLLCGSVLPYEIPAFHKALEICGGLEVRPVAISVPGEFREYCRELFGGEMEMAEASHNLFAERTNGRLYKRLVEPYIMGERRL